MMPGTLNQMTDNVKVGGIFGYSIPASVEHSAMDILKGNRVLIASYSAGIVGIIAGFPLDSIKTRIQTGSHDGIRRCVVDTVKSEGMMGLYRGIMPPMLTTSILKSFVFMIYEKTKSFSANNITMNSSSRTNDFIGGMTGGLIVSAISAPLDFLKTKMQLHGQSIRNSGSQHHTFCSSVSKMLHVPGGRESRFIQSPSNFSAAMELFSLDGIKCFYRGYLPQMAREVIGFGTYFSVYESLCSALSPTGKKADSGPYTHLISGGLSGLAIWLIIFPFDLIKSKMQKDRLVCLHCPSNPTCRKSSRAPMMNQGGVAYAKQILAARGIVGLYQGIIPCLLRAFPVHASVFVVYEYLKNALPS